MANNFKMMRGLYIPDANFDWPMADTWTLNNIAAAEIRPRGPRAIGGYEGAYTYGTGRSLAVDLAAMPAVDWTDYIESDYSPLTIAAEPFSSATLRIYLAAIVRTAGVASDNTTDLVRLHLQGYTDAGAASTYWATAPTFAYSAGDYVLIGGNVNASIAAGVDWYKMRVYFRSPSTGAGAVMLDWVGAGIQSYTDAAGDTISSMYTCQFAHSSQTSRKWISEDGAERPLIHISHRAAHRQEATLTFPYLSSEDEQLIQVCWMWNAGTPTDDADHDDGVYHQNRGTSQPVFIAMDREDCKRAFYADFASAPQFSQNIQGYWPDTDAIWNATLNLRERL